MGGPGSGRKKGSGGNSLIKNKIAMRKNAIKKETERMNAADKAKKDAQRIRRLARGLKTR